MRLGLFGFITALSFAAPAWAQTSFTLDARNGPPVVEAQINGRDVRLEVDTRVPDMLAVSTPSAERIGLRRLPFAAVAVGIEGGSTIRGRIARPRISFGERASRAFAGVFPAPASHVAEGLIGPGAMPYDVITITLDAEPAQAREIRFALEDADVWRVSTQVGGETLLVTFDVTNPASVFNRSAARLFDRAGAIPAAGELAETPMVLGLTTMMQPVTTELTVEGLTLAPAFARTNAPLLGALEEDAIVAAGETDAPPPSLVVGRAALARAGCSSISVHRRTRQLTLRCAA